jgi:hypothetical protein
MCYAIYISLIALFIFYTDYNLSQYVLSTQSGDNQWISVALGWEIIPEIWPAFILVMAASSAFTLLISRRIQANRNAGNDHS